MLRAPSYFLAIATRYRARRALTLVEVMVATGVLGMVIVGCLGALVQSRRITETSIYQNAAITVVQGYLEQIKEAEIASIPYYSGSTLIPSNSTDPIVGVSTANRPKAIKTLLNNTDVDTIGTASGETITDFLLISSGTPPSIASIVPGAALPIGSNIEDNTKLIDVNQSLVKTEDLRLRLWVWVQDLSAAGTDATQVRGITIIYQWARADGNRVRWFVDSVRSIRSSVPTM
jgi:Tfp pilus assembly protein PilV